MRARTVALGALGLAVVSGFIVPLALWTRLPAPATVALMFLGGCLALAAATYILVTAAPPDWGRSLEARRLAFGLFVLGMAVGVAVPLFFR
jgi:CBS domain containing-hemolysin-like protein